MSFRYVSPFFTTQDFIQISPRSTAPSRSAFPLAKGRLAPYLPFSKMGTFQFFPGSSSTMKCNTWGSLKGDAILPDQTVREVGDKFIQSPINVLVVVSRESGPIQGIITLHDLIRAQASVNT